MIQKFANKGLADPILASRLRKAGFENSLRTIWEARGANLPLSYALAFLEKETGRGQNVFGNDSTTSIPDSWKGKPVTSERYKYYKRYRNRYGMQGVGPMQLTWWETQDKADRIGGCDKPKYNLRVGFGMAASLIRTYGIFNGVMRYNGSGPAAEAYARDWAHKQTYWHRYLTR